MTGLGEDVYTDRSTALDALTEESQRMGMYGDAPDVEKMVEEAAMTIADAWNHEFEPAPPTDIADWREYARAALESLGIPLSVLAELKAGTRKAVRVEKFTLPSGRAGRIPNAGDVFDSAPKTPEAAR